MKRFFLTSIAACASALLALAASAQTPTPAQPPAATPGTEGKSLLAQAPAQTSPEQMLKTEPSAAGPRPLTRAEVIRELRRARAAGEMDWYDRESTGFMR